MTITSEFINLRQNPTSLTLFNHYANVEGRSQRSLCEIESAIEIDNATVVQDFRRPSS